MTVRCCSLVLWQYFFHHRNAVDVRQVIKEAYRLDEAMPRDLHPSTKLQPFTPLTQGQYPVFNKYPKFIVDYQVSEFGENDRTLLAGARRGVGMMGKGKAGWETGTGGGGGLGGGGFAMSGQSLSFTIR